ncbi:hypothetical protein MMAD_31520 [Mycolicibacterium madagascariense]|uniref:Uncharacterized protein n=1 Tax=Mycolicibacterium madagascariense TaxID=212765 RepID=A0A7I7XI22_9MYCO|nr:hypothetical protein MMAD_31520 [Mycolicibacterium madagascariense]
MLVVEVCGSVLAAVGVWSTVLVTAAVFAAAVFVPGAEWVSGVVRVVDAAVGVCAVVSAVEEAADPVCVVALRPVVLG